MATYEQKLVQMLADCELEVGFNMVKVQWSYGKAVKMEKIDGKIDYDDDDLKPVQFEAKDRTPYPLKII